MGMMTPAPPVFGDNCMLCDPGLWATGETPLYVKMAINQVVACPGAPHPAPNGLVALRQLDLHPCIWKLITDNYTFLWFNGGGNTQCMITSPPVFGSYFSWNEPPACITTMTNRHLNCVPPDALGYGGTVRIFWP